MKEYIERDKLFQKVLEEKRFVLKKEDMLNQAYVIQTVYGDFADFVNSIPAADVVERKRGEWISVKERLPEDSGGVNLCTRSGIVGTGFYDKYTKNWVQYYSGGALCVDVLDTSAVWFGVTYREDRQSVRDALLKMHESGEYPKALKI